MDVCGGAKCLSCPFLILISFVPISCHISISQYCLSLSRPYLTNHLRIVSVTLVGSWLLGGAGCLGTSTQTSQHHQQNTRTSQQLQPTVLNQVSSSNKILHNSQQINQKFHSFLRIDGNKDFYICNSTYHHFFISKENIPLIFLLSHFFDQLFVFLFQNDLFQVIRL